MAEACGLLARLSVHTGALAALRAADAPTAARNAARRLLGTALPTAAAAAAEGAARLVSARVTRSIVRLEQALAAPPQQHISSTTMTPTHPSLDDGGLAWQSSAGAHSDGAGLSFRTDLAAVQRFRPAQEALIAPPHPAVASALRPASATLAGMTRSLRPLATVAASRLRPASATLSVQISAPARRPVGGDAGWDGLGTGTRNGSGPAREELLLEREICALRREAEAVRNENLRLLSGAVGGGALAAAAAAAGLGRGGLLVQGEPQPPPQVGTAAVSQAGSGWTPARMRPAQAARPRSGLRLNLVPLS